MKVYFLPPAVLELEDACKWYELQKPELGREFLDEIEAAIRRIVSWPKSAGRIGEGLHRCLLRRFPYGLIYGIDIDKVVIVAVAHLHRKPFYWTGRRGWASFS